MAKTKLEVVSVYDGTMDATELFVSLIAEKIAMKNEPMKNEEKTEGKNGHMKQQEILAKSEYPWYNGFEVPTADPCASGLCG